MGHAPKRNKNQNDKKIEENIITMIFLQKNEEQNDKKATSNQTISFPFAFGKINNLLVSKDEQSLIVTHDTKIYIYPISEINPLTVLVTSVMHDKLVNRLFVST